MEATAVHHEVDTEALSFGVEVNEAVASQDVSLALALIISAFAGFATASRKVGDAIRAIVAVRKMPGFVLADAITAIDKALAGEDKDRASVRVLARIAFTDGVEITADEDWAGLYKAVRRARTAAQRHACVKVVNDGVASRRLKRPEATMSFTTAATLIDGLFVKPREEKAPEVLVTSGAKSLYNAVLKLVALASADNTNEDALTSMVKSRDELSAAIEALTTTE